MKLLFNFIFLLFLPFNFCAQDNFDYNNIVKASVHAWQNECINQLSTQEIMIIADMLLLSYQVVQASVIMSQARLIIQSELFNIVTLSINDTFDVRIQAQNNDLTKIKAAVYDIEQAQEKIKSACNALKGFGPIIIKIDPSVIQQFIANFKEVILHWVKTQQETITEIEEFHTNLHATDDTFEQVAQIFQTIIHTDPVDHSQLLQGTNNLTGMYNILENMFENLTKIRQKSLANFNTVLMWYFKSHYQILYDHLKNMHALDLKLAATQGHTLPDPSIIFI